MRIWEQNGEFTVPMDSPVYPPPPAHYRDVMFQMVFFNTATHNIRALLPTPLEPAASSSQIPLSLHGVSEALLGGWRLNYIFQANSGYPLDLLSAVGGRPNLVGGRTANLPASQRTVDRWFDRSAFQAPQAGTLGNLTHNGIDGPGFKQLDLGIAKVFSLPWEKHSLEFRSELFNILNHPNFYFLGNRNFDAPGAERLDGVWDSRSIQFALRYSF